MWVHPANSMYSTSRPALRNALYASLDPSTVTDGSLSPWKILHATPLVFVSLLGFTEPQIGMAAANFSGYLATIFKKETGQTLTEYVTGKRIEHAIFLLNCTNMQIQTIAQYCGIPDICYFTKTFKKMVKLFLKNPEYRLLFRFFA